MIHYNPVFSSTGFIMWGCSLKAVNIKGLTHSWLTHTGVSTLLQPHKTFTKSVAACSQFDCHHFHTSVLLWLLMQTVCNSVSNYNLDTHLIRKTENTWVDIQGFNVQGFGLIMCLVNTISIIALLLLVQRYFWPHLWLLIWSENWNLHSVFPSWTRLWHAILHRCRNNESCKCFTLWV